MGINSVGAGSPQVLAFHDTSSLQPQEVKQPAPKSALVPAQYQSGFDATPLAQTGAQPVPAEITHSFVKMNSLMADLLMKAGEYEKARAMNQTTRVFLEKVGATDGRDDQLRGVESVPQGDKGPTISDENRQATFGEEVARKDAQINQAEKMSKVIGRPVDLHNLNDVKAYFDTVSKSGASTAQIQQEYGEYLKNNYATVHGNEWGATPPLAQRVEPGAVTQMMASQPKDVTGRPVIDCEGATYLTGAIFGKNPRFDTVYTDGGSHLAASIFEKGTNRGFSVDLSRRTPVNEFRSETDALMTKDKIPKDRQQELVAKGQHGERGNGRMASRDLPTLYLP